MQYFTADNVIITGAESVDHMKSMLAEAQNLLKVIGDVKAAERDEEKDQQAGLAGTLGKDLKSSIEQLQTHATGGVRQAKSNKLTYEIFCGKGSSADGRMLKALEEKVTSLERTIFGSSNNATATAEDQPPISTKLASISKKLRNLNRGKIESIAESLHSLNKQVDQAIAAADMEDSKKTSDADRRIRELHSLTYDYINSRDIPHLVARYETMLSISQQEKVLQARLNSVEQQQTEMLRKLDASRQAMTLLGKSMATNMDVLAKNLTELGVK